jgi:hypothetical protein
MRVHIKLGAGILASAMAVSAYAGPSGLTSMPIADVLNHREGYFCNGMTGVEHNISRGYAYTDALEIGLFGVSEVGYDTDFNGNWVLNGKAQLIKKRTAQIDALSIGFMNYHDGVADKYVVARRDGKGYRLHAGLVRNPDDQGVFGLDAPLCKGTLMLEWQTGWNSRGWAGYIAPVPFFKGLQWQLGVGVPGVHQNGTQHFMQLCYDFRF